MNSTKSTQKELLAAYRKSLESASFDIQQEVSLCLSDIPREKMRKAKNGKIYVNLIVAMRKEPDQWGRDLKVYVQQSQADKEKKEPKVYVGGGKTFIFDGQEPTSPTEDDVNGIIPGKGDEQESDVPF